MSEENNKEILYRIKGYHDEFIPIHNTFNRGVDYLVSRVVDEHYINEPWDLNKPNEKYVEIIYNGLVRTYRVTGEYSVDWFEELLEVRNHKEENE